MRVLIVGCGRVGSQLALEMSKEGHDVTIVDRDPSAFAKAAARGVLGTNFTGNEMVGDGVDAEILKRAGVEDADVFIAVTEGDNRNIMAAQIAQHVYKVPKVIVRIYDPEREGAYRDLGLSTICPTVEGTNKIRHMIGER
jgi:trk system potassium uptake protein TrkA